jgi:FlaA1/EpsC-like NDP-sugar epimerase
MASLISVSISEPVKQAVHRSRRSVAVLVQVLLMALSNYAAWLLRYDNDLPAWAVTSIAQTLPLIVAIRAIAFVPFRLYQGLWRYTSVHDMLALLAAIATSTVLSFGLVYWLFSFDAYPRSVFIIDALLLAVLLGSTRMVHRVYLSLSQPARVAKRMLVYGAGDAGEMIVREMRHNPAHGYLPIGFVDDERGKVGRRIHGVPVFGGREALADIIGRYRPDAVLIALPSVDAATTRGILKALEPFNLPIKTLPNLPDVVAGRVAVTQIRSLSIEDLLRRPPVGLDDAPVRRLVEGRSVLVTGAAGSIGSELCRQIALFNPARLLMVDRNENGLYAVGEEFSAHPLAARIDAVVADVTDAALMDATFCSARPDIVFHAAAHKHVPLMERHPCEAVKNNVGGTRVMVDCAARHRVGRFVFISSDKAVNPTSVMGATKRLGELVIQAAGERDDTEFLAVRFGNVLGSNGSVVPKFLKQIDAGGPVTVTHPDMTRYFMLIPEAVQLVLHAAALGGPGAVFVLEMGEPVRVVDMARHLIHLAGFTPEQDIAITFTGLRPGEKLFEELVTEQETVEASGIPKVMRMRSAALPDGARLATQLATLERLASDGDRNAVIRQLATMIPEFVPGDTASQPLTTGLPAG